jgi:hypothetical protein
MFVATTGGISYLFHANDYQYEQYSTDNANNVTISSTIVDQQGIVKRMIRPRMNHCYVRHEKIMNILIDKCQVIARLIPSRIDWQRIDRHAQHQRALLFFWSATLNARQWQLSTRISTINTHVHVYERYPIEISQVNQNVGEHEK